MVLAWQRLVRAGKVQHGRKHSPMWREGERRRVAAMVEQHRLALRSNEDWADDSTRTCAWGQRYAWDLEASIQAQLGVSNGAAAVMARRRQDGGSSGGAQPAAAGSSVQHAQGGRSKRGRADDSPGHALRHDDAQHGSDRNESDGAVGDSAHEAPMAPRRSGDGLLVYNTLSLQRLEAQLRSPYYWQRAPFGDG